jgi:hypothetical protein
MIRTATTPRRSHIRRLEVQVGAVLPLTDVRPQLLLSIVARLPPCGLRNAPEPSFVAREFDLRGRGWRTFRFVVTADGGASMSGAAQWSAHSRRSVDHLL